MLYPRRAVDKCPSEEMTKDAIGLWSRPCFQAYTSGGEMGRWALNQGTDRSNQSILVQREHWLCKVNPVHEGWGWPGGACHQPQSLQTSVAIFKACLPLLPGLEGGRAFFNAVKEGDTVIFASDDEQDRILWVQAMYRATGQSHKPVPPTQVQKLNAKGGNVPQLDAPISQFCK